MAALNWHFWFLLSLRVPKCPERGREVCFLAQAGGFGIEAALMLPYVNWAKWVGLLLVLLMMEDIRIRKCERLGGFFRQPWKSQILRCKHKFGFILPREQMSLSIKLVQLYWVSRAASGEKALVCWSSVCVRWGYW